VLLILNNIDMRNAQLIVDKLKNQPESTNSFDIINYITARI